MKGIVMKSALSTVITLFGGLAIGLVLGQLVFRLIPGNDANNLKIGHAMIAAVPALSGVLAGAFAWGVQMSRLAGASKMRRTALPAMLLPLTV